MKENQGKQAWWEDELLPAASVCGGHTVTVKPDDRHEGSWIDHLLARGATTGSLASSGQSHGGTYIWPLELGRSDISMILVILTPDGAIAHQHVPHDSI